MRQKFLKAVQELKNLAKQNDGNNGGNCWTKITDEPKHFGREYFGGSKKKWKKTLISSLVITLVNQKEKEIWNNQNKTLQHDKN